MSVAGGLPRAVERAVVHRCEALQIFAKNANQWRGREVPREEIREFRARVAAAGIGPVVSHASYLINLATSVPALRRQSLEAMGDELDRAEALGLLGVVLHPGCYTSGSEAEGSRLIADGLLELLRARRRGRTMILLEHTAGPGHGARRDVRAARVDHRQDERPPARRRLPRYLPPARVGLRPLLAGRIRVDVHAVRPAGGIRPAEGVSPQRLEEAARQPRRSPRAHRPGLPRPRALPPHRQRPAVSRAADDARDAEGRGPLAGEDRARSLRRAEPGDAARSDRAGGQDWRGRTEGQSARTA